jgi:putative flippase GtrA
MSVPASLALDVVVPVHNEAVTLERQIGMLADHMRAHFGEPWRITIADNASTDDTAAIADRLAGTIDHVRVLHLAEKGRGRALRAAWTGNEARVVAYVDEDLSTELSALAPLVAPLLSGHSDVAIGSRLTRSSRVTRGDKREFVSRSYNVLLRQVLGVGFSDAQCGFKALRTEVADLLVPLVEDQTWFFDTELLVLAERSGLRIHEVPVDWIDDPDSRVDVVRTSIDDLRGVRRLAWNLARGRIPVDDVYQSIGRRPFERARPGMLGQLLRFGIVGVLSTLAYALLYLLFRGGMGDQLANFVALAVTAIANTAANRRFTFGIRGQNRAVLHQFQGLAVFALAWVVTSGSLVGTHVLDPHASGTTTLIVLTCANLVATLLRFVLFRAWVFRSRSRGGRSVATSVADVSAASRPTDEKAVRP